MCPCLIVMWSTFKPKYVVSIIYLFFTVLLFKWEVKDSFNLSKTSIMTLDFRGLSCIINTITFLSGILMCFEICKLFFHTIYTPIYVFAKNAFILLSPCFFGPRCLACKTYSSQWSILFSHCKYGSERGGARLLQRYVCSIKHWFMRLAGCSFLKWALNHQHERWLPPETSKILLHGTNL